MLITSLLFTIAAVITACVAIPYLFWRRWRVDKAKAHAVEMKEREKYWREIERIQDEDIN